MISRPAAGASGRAMGSPGRPPTQRCAARPGGARASAPAPLLRGKRARLIRRPVAAGGQGRPFAGPPAAAAAAPRCGQVEFGCVTEGSGGGTVICTAEPNAVTGLLAGSVFLRQEPQEGTSVSKVRAPVAETPGGRMAMGRLILLRSIGAAAYRCLIMLLVNIELRGVAAEMRAQLASRAEKRPGPSGG